MKIGLCTIAFSKRPIGDVLALAADAGFDGVEVWGKEGHIGAGDTQTVSRIREAAKAHGLAVHCFGSYMTPLDPPIPELFPLTDNGLRIAHDLGAPMVRIWAPYVKPDQLPSDQYDPAVADIRAFCAKAAELGITVVVEFHDNTIVERSEGLLRLIDDVGAANLKAHWQPSFRADAEGFYESLENLLPHLAHVHAQNFRGSYENRTQLADGDVDYRRVVGMLGDAGYEGAIEVEFVGGDNPEDWARRDCEFLKKIAGEN